MAHRNATVSRYCDEEGNFFECSETSRQPNTATTLGGDNLQYFRESNGIIDGLATLPDAQGSGASGMDHEGELMGRLDSEGGRVRVPASSSRAMPSE
jgi:hypothetical protein